MPSTPADNRPYRGNPRTHAQTIAERVAHAWLGSYRSNDLEIPLSIVAALSQLCPVGDHEPVTAALLAAEPAPFAATIRSIWHQFLRHRPDLINPVWPLVRPWEDDTPAMDAELLSVVKAVGDAALRADMLALTATDARLQVDLLGYVYTLLRSPKSQQLHGQYYTSPDVTALMASFVFANFDADNDTRVSEDCCGTGGLLRAAAWEMRSRGADPADERWEGVDLDATAVACCAVNVVLWGLGRDVLLGVGDVLLDNWKERALALRRQTVAIARNASMERAFRALMRGPRPRPESRSAARRARVGALRRSDTAPTAVLPAKPPTPTGRALDAPSPDLDTSPASS